MVGFDAHLYIVQNDFSVLPARLMADQLDPAQKPSCTIVAP